MDHSIETIVNDLTEEIKNLNLRISLKQDLVISKYANIEAQIDKLEKTEKELISLKKVEKEKTKELNKLTKKLAKIKRKPVLTRVASLL